MIARKRYVSAGCVMAALAAAIAAAPSGALAQEAKPPEEPTLSVFVPDSSVATERFALADKLQTAREWGKAAEIYQELIENYRDRVVAADSGPDTSKRYISVAERVINQVSQWPAEGLGAYNGRFQPAAEELLAKASGPADLRNVAERYFLTDAGRTAALRLIQIYWQAGDAAAAAHLAERVAKVVPSDSPLQPTLLMYAGLAWHIAGADSRATKVLEELKAHHAAAHGIVAGQDVVYADQLQTAMALQAKMQTSASGWESFGGPPDRAQPPAVAGRPDALLFSVETADATPTAMNQPNFIRQGPTLNQSLGIYPVYDHRELYFQDGVNLHAISIDGGMRLAGWSSTSIPLTSNMQGSATLRTLALAPDAIYAAVANSNNQPWVADSPDSSQLICIDRRNGQVRWRVTPGQLSEKQPNLKSTQFASPPLVVDDRLFVVARGGRNAQFHDIFALCFDRQSGKLLWTTYVASGPNINMAIFEDPSLPTNGTLPQLSFSAQRLVIVTNVGVIASLEASDGAPVWLRAYQRMEAPSFNDGLRAMSRMQANIAGARIFAASPAVISSGRIFALPVDSRSVLALDEADGSLLKQISRASLGSVDTLVGLIGNNLVVSGADVASALDWTKASDGDAPQSDALNWTMEFPGNPLRGRPFLTTDSLFLPTDDRLLRVGINKWKIEQTTPAYPAVWEGGQGPGNVLVTDEHVVVAAQSRVNIYTNLEAASARLDREAQQSPNSADALMRHGELLFAAGKYDGSVAKFSHALAVVGRTDSAPERERLFTATLGAATRAASLTSTSSPADGFLKIAQSAITSPMDAVQYYLTTSLLALRNNNSEASLEALQAILEDPARRAVLHRDGEMPRRHASEIASSRIIQLMDRFGPAIYKPVEQRARARFDQAMAAGNADALMEVALSFPNAACAPDALFAAGKICEQSKRLSDAASAYRTLVQEYSDHPRAAEFVESMARIYASMPGKASIAAGRLAYGAAAYGDPNVREAIRMPDGSLIAPGPFSKVAAAIREAAGLQRTTTLPDYGLPSKGKVFGEPIALGLVAERILWPMPSDLPDPRRAVVQLDKGGIAVLDVSGKPIATVQNTGIEKPGDYIWISPDRLGLHNGTFLRAMDLPSSRVAWQLDTANLPPLQQTDDASGESPLSNEDDQLQQKVTVVLNAPAGAAGGVRIVGGAVRSRAPELSDDITAAISTEGKVIVSTGSGRILAVDSATGSILWQLRPEAGRVGRLAASDEFTAARIVAAQRSLVVAIDNKTGRVVFARSQPAGDEIQNVVISDDGQLIFTTASRLVAKDLFDHSDRYVFDVALDSRTAFLRQDNEDQLLISGDVIIATTDNGAQVRLFSRLTGQQIAPGGEKSQSPAARMPAKRRESRTRLVLAEPYVFAYNQGAVCAINLERAEPVERRLPDAVQNLKAVLPGRNHVIAVEQPVRPYNAVNFPSIQFMAFSRNRTAAAESGRLDHSLQIEPAGEITSWQMLEGGLLMATGDKKLLYYPAIK